MRSESVSVCRLKSTVRDIFYNIIAGVIRSTFCCVSVSEFDLLERVAFWLNTMQRAARARSKFIDLLVPVPGTTCLFVHTGRDPLASRDHARLMRMFSVCHAYDLI